MARTFSGLDTKTCGYKVFVLVVQEMPERYDTFEKAFKACHKQEHKLMREGKATYGTKIRACK